MPGAARERGFALPDGSWTTAAALLAAIALGVLSAYSAFAVHPLVLPAALALVSLAAVTAVRPEIGIAAAFVMIPLGNIGLTGQPPWALVSAWSAYLCGLGMWGATRSGTLQRPPPLAVPVLLFMGLSAVGFAVAAEPEEALPVVRSLIVGFLLLVAIATLIRERRQVQWVFAGTSATAVIIGVYAIYQYTAGTAPEGFLTSGGTLVSRVGAGFGHPNQLGGFLVLLAPFSLAGALLSNRGRFLHIAALACASLGIYLSFSRGALIALVLIPFFFLRGRRALLIAPMIVLLLAVATPSLVQERFSALTTDESNVSSRLDIWRTAMTIWTEHPVIGVGLGGFPQAYAEAPTPGKQFLPQTLFKPPPHAHNLFLQMLAEQGLAGLVALLGVLVTALVRAGRLRRASDRWMRLSATAVLASLVAFVIHNQFDVTLLETTALSFWGLLGLLSALVTINARDGALAGE